MPLDVVDGLADGLDLFGLLIGDREFELVLELHDEFYGVQRVGVEVVDEMGLARDLALVDTHLLADDLDDLRLNVVHILFHLPCGFLTCDPAALCGVRGAVVGRNIAVTGPFATILTRRALPIADCRVPNANAETPAPFSSAIGN